MAPDALRMGLVAAALLAGCGGGDDDAERRPAPSGPAIAVIGDTPYGAERVAAFREDVAAINADPDVRLVIHLGDIQEGPSPCTDAHLARIRGDFDAFEDPLVYTPGDNEWTDCHRSEKGSHKPTERLAALRARFFPRPGRTLGKARPVQAQDAPFVENVRWRENGVVFTTLHVPGSNNGTEPWFEAPALGREQRAENRARLRANLAWLDAAFDQAEARGAPAVAIAMQANTWPERGSTLDTSGYVPILNRLARRAAAFRRPVLVLQGDTHRFHFDLPLRAAPNVVRVVVQGATTEPREWLKLHVSRTADVFTWERVRLPG